MPVAPLFSPTTGANGGATPAASWRTRLDYDLTAIATFGALASGNNVIDGLTWAVSVSTGSVTMDHTNGVGLTVSANISTNTQTLQANVFSSLLAGPNTNPVRITMVVDSISINTNSQAVTSTVSSGVQATSGSSRVPGFGIRLHRTSTTDFRMRTYTNGTGATIGGTNGISASSGVTIAASAPTQAVFETYIYSSLAAGLITLGQTTVPTALDPFVQVFEPNTNFNRASYMAAIADRATAIDPWPAVWVGPGIYGAGTSAYSYVIKRIVVQEWY